MFQGLPAVRGLDAPLTEFSAGRADAVLAKLLGPEIPHPVSTDANKAVRDRIRKAFADLGIKTTVYRALGCNGYVSHGEVVCGTTEDIIAEVAPGQGKAIVLLAHYDSAPAGPGASDDQASVASIIEAVRALQARGMRTIHPVLAVITDGEEAGLLGAASFLHNPALKARVGVVVNAEARGNQGPSLFFQTSPGNSKLVDIYAQGVPTYATTSLLPTIYKYLPNDTDLTLFLNQGFTGFNFAFIERVAHYHTALDRRENLNPATLQMQGNNILGVASGLMQTEYATLKGPDSIFFSLYGVWLPRLDVGWALPLAIIGLVLLLVAAFAPYKEEAGIGRRLLAFVIVPVVITLSVVFGFVLFETASLISGQADPSYAHPVWLRLAFAYGVLASMLVTARLSSARMTALAVWFWIAVLGVVTAALLPGASPYFVFPALIAGALLAAQAFAPDAWKGKLATAALVVAGLVMLLVWMPLVSMTENVGGLVLHPIVTGTAALCMSALVPLLAPTHWLRLAGASVIAAFLCAVLAGFQPAFSPTFPQRLDVNFVEDHIDDKATWRVSTSEPLPAPYRRIGNFSATSAHTDFITYMPSYSEPAGPLRYNVPSADVVLEQKGAGRIAHIALDAPDANALYIIAPPNAGITHLQVQDWNFDIPPGTRPTFIACKTRDCSHIVFALTFASRKAVALTVIAQRFALPRDALPLLAAQPATAVTSWEGNNTIIYGKVQLP